MKGWYCGGLLVLLCCVWVSVAIAAVPNDAYIAGYAAAIVERDFHVPHASVTVQGGIVRLHSDDLSAVDQQKLMNALRTIPGVSRVELLSNGQLAATAAGAPSAPLAVRQDQQQVAADLSSKEEDHFLPQGYLFDQLTADVRWPHFSVAYNY